MEKRNARAERERETEGEFGDGRKDFVFTLEPVVYCFLFIFGSSFLLDRMCVTELDVF